MTPDAQRIARQHLRADRMLGLDFVPVAHDLRAADRETPGVGLTDDEQTRLKAEALEMLRQDHEANCPHCTQAEGWTNMVFGEGNPDAELMFIGEAPGMEEDRTGRPFVGRAGEKLNEMIRAMGLERGDVYIANVLKTRPPNNRDPQRQEVDRCSPYLMKQIRLIDPAVIVTMGNPATKFLLQTETGITRMRGQWWPVTLGERQIDVMPTFHPAYILRNYTRETREKVWSDLQKVMSRLGL
jgi:uracil-DNA glycosylase family 4